MADLRVNVSPGYVSNSPKDNVSTAGAQMCNVGNIMTVKFSVLWFETACRQELYLISRWEILAFISRGDKERISEVKEKQKM